MGVMEYKLGYSLAMRLAARRRHADPSVLARARRARHETCNSNKNLGYFTYDTVYTHARSNDTRYYGTHMGCDITYDEIICVIEITDK